ncbi:LysR family transcriptional regulator [Burkholderia pseudomultivorans]|uniref:LysR family transcriptional regulator n=1 Tax=Burkholderia pseudomultivorans TaxID=1207504 RepID=UPI002875D271|nr:LysR family transcriptional regulator [Burkholderia pseudomultivorans]MDS0856224.1 LysR family transcriptional regulator [Burkholderia pseudomultivorans]
MDECFDGIREFVAAIDHGSFSAAAVELGVTGSAVGKSISRLEKRLGVQLLHRTTRRIDLTTAGETFLETCRRVQDELHATESLLAAGRREPSGRVRIDLPTTFGRRHVAPALLRLTQRYPRLDLSLSLQDRSANLIGEGIDLAVRIGLLDDFPDLIARKLGQQRLTICASPAYLERRGTPVSADDLNAHDCLVGWQRSGRPGWLVARGEGATEYIDVRVRHELTDGDTLLDACIAGCGLAQLPGWLAADSVASGKLREVLPQLSTTMPIHVIWQRTRHLQPKVQAVVDELERLASVETALFNP